MNTENHMDYYQPIETKSTKQEHTILYSFQFEEATAQIVSSTVGNVSGAAVMETDFSLGFAVPVDHELTKRHVVFFNDEDEGLEYREVGSIVLLYPDGKRKTLDIEDCENYLVGIQIIGYEPN